MTDCADLANMLPDLLRVPRAGAIRPQFRLYEGLSWGRNYGHRFNVWFSEQATLYSIWCRFTEDCREGAPLL